MLKPLETYFYQLVGCEVLPLFAKYGTDAHSTSLDMLCFAWDFASVGPGAAKIVEHISLPPSTSSPRATGSRTRIEYAGLHSFALDHKSTLPSPRKTPIPGVNAMEGAFTFSLSNPKGTGRGYFRLFQVPSSEGKLTWKAASVLLSLWDIAGHVESFDRVHGHISGLSGRGLWDDVEDEKKASIESDPTVLIGAVAFSPIPDNMLIVCLQSAQGSLDWLLQLACSTWGYAFSAWKGRLGWVMYGGIGMSMFCCTSQAANDACHSYDNLTLHTSTYTNSRKFVD